MGSRLQNIDLLRAAAIVSVLLYHFTVRIGAAIPGIEAAPLTFPHGYLGVDLFFAVSGYCIFMTLERARDVRWFWARRIARLQPVYMAGATLTFLVVTIFGFPGRELSVTEALGNLIWLTLYPEWKLIDGAFWSLLVELKFYFWVGLIYAIRKGRSICIAWALFCVFGAILLRIPQTSYWSVLLIPIYAPSFLVGMIAYESRRMTLPRTAVLLIFAFALEIASPRYGMGGRWFVGVMALGFCVLMMPNLRVPRPIRFIGLISYPVYIVHQNIGYILIRDMPGPMTVRIACAIVVAFAIAVPLWWALDKRFETPIAERIYRLLNPQVPVREELEPVALAAPVRPEASDPAPR